MPYVPYVPVEPTLVHSLANTTVALVVHEWHHLTIEHADTLELLAAHREAAEGSAGLFVKGLGWRAELLVSLWFEGQ